MRKNLALMLLGITSAFFVACSTQKNYTGKISDVKYKVARNYFFNNDAIVPSNPMVTSQKDFDKLYGAAAVMGKDGAPTAIDFSKQVAIGIVLPLTNNHTEVVPTRLTSDGEVLTLHYKEQIGEKNMSWTMRPMAIVIVDKKYKGKTCVLEKD